MSPYYGIAVRLDGAYEVYMTDDGIRRTPVPSAIYDKPRDAIRYADMRQANISPLRAPGDEPASPPAGSSSGVLTGTDPESWPGK